MRVCCDAVFPDLVRFCGNFYFIYKVAVLQFYKTKRFAVFRNFRVTAMTFAVFLCYSLWGL